MRSLLAILLPACLPEFPAQVFVEDPTHDADGDGFTEIDGDCDDDSALVYPGAVEVCDDRDNDCDGRSDEITDPDDDNYVVDAPVWYGDDDGDGYGTDSYTLTACSQPGINAQTAPNMAAKTTAKGIIRKPGRIASAISTASPTPSPPI